MADKRLLTQEEILQLEIGYNSVAHSIGGVSYGDYVAKAQLAKADRHRLDSPGLKHRIDRIIADARSTAYADAVAGKLPYRIGNIDFQKAILALLKGETDG